MCRGPQEPQQLCGQRCVQPALKGTETPRHRLNGVETEGPGTQGGEEGVLQEQVRRGEKPRVREGSTKPNHYLALLL